MSSPENPHIEFAKKGITINNANELEVLQLVQSHIRRPGAEISLIIEGTTGNVDGITVKALTGDRVEQAGNVIRLTSFTEKIVLDGALNADTVFIKTPHFKPDGSEEYFNIQVNKGKNYST